MRDCCTATTKAKEVKVPCPANRQESLPLSRNGSSRRYRESPAHCPGWKYFRGERKDVILRKLLLSVYGLIALCLPFPEAFAEEIAAHAAPAPKIRATYLDEIIEVTTSKVDATLLETPATINIITAADIQNSGQRELSGIIASIPGVFDDGSGTTYFNFRGTRSSMSEGAAIYLDGKPLNVGRHDYSAIDDIPLDIVEKIEVVKSPAASIYGANAARGVIHIITNARKNARSRFEKTISLGIGSWRTYSVFASVLGRINRWDYSLQFNHDRAQGYRRTDPRRTLLNGRVGFEIARGVDIDFTMGWDDSWKKSSTPLEYWALADRRQNAPMNLATAGTYRIRPNELDHRLLSNGLALGYDRGNWRMHGALDYSHYDDDYAYLRYFHHEGNGTTQRGQGSYREDRNEDKVNLKYSLGRAFTHGEALHTAVTVGYDYAFTGFDQVRAYPYATSLGATAIRNINKNTLEYTKKIHGIFLSNDLKLGSWGLVAGLRQDFVAYDLHNRAAVQIGKSFEAVNWDIAPSYHFTQHSNLYFSMGRNHWYPTAGYFTSAMDYDDPLNQPEDLQAEKYLNYEIGFKQRVNKSLNYSLSLYRSAIDNKYMPYYSEEGSFKGYKHVGKSLHQGIELATDGVPKDWLGYRLSFSWTHAEWNEARAPISVYGETPAQDANQILDISGKKLYRVPDYQYLAGVTLYPLRRLSVSLDIHGYGKQYIDAYNRYDAGAVNLVDFKTGYALSRNLDLYLLGSNILDTQYESIFNATGARVAEGIPDNEYYPRNGRYLEAGIKVRF